MSVLVTGASGFVGKHLIDALRRTLPTSVKLIAVDREKSDSQPPQDEVIRASVDMTDAGAVDRLVRSAKPSRVVHLAARSSVSQAQNAARATFDVNFGGTQILANALRKHAPGCVVIFASTGEVYGSAFASGLPLAETAPVLPTNPYARSKLAAEFMLADTLSEVCPVIALRLLNHTGPGQDERFVVPAFAAQIARIEAGVAAPVVRVGNLMAERDFIDIADVVDAYLLALGLAESTTGFHLFNVGSGAVRSIASILNELIAMSTSACAIEQDPTRMRASDIPRAICAISAFGSATGWTAKRNWSDTLHSVLDYWRAKTMK